MRIKLGLVIGTTSLIITDLANAQQAVTIGIPPFASPLYSLPGATPENYPTVDPSSAQGAMIDLYKAIATSAGLEIRFLAFVAGQLPSALKSGKIDMRHAPISPENQSFMTFSDPIFADSEVLIANKADTTLYKSYADLKGQIVGSRTGTIYEDDMRKNGLEVKSYASGPELYRAVNAGEIKVAINTRYIPTAYALLKKQYPNVQIVKSYQPKFLDVTGIGTLRERRALIERVNISLGKLKANGTMQAIFAKYGIADALTK